jgi:hypothetical protein
VWREGGEAEGKVEKGVAFFSIPYSVFPWSCITSRSEEDWTKSNPGSAEQSDGSTGQQGLFLWRQLGFEKIDGQPTGYSRVSSVDTYGIVQ